VYQIDAIVAEIEDGKPAGNEARRCAAEELKNKVGLSIESINDSLEKTCQRKGTNLQALWGDR
jgi:hypothetical protein